MACGCRKSSAGSVTANGTIKGYEVIYPDGSKHDGLFLTPMEAKREIRHKGGGTARVVYES